MTSKNTCWLKAYILCCADEPAPEQKEQQMSIEVELKLWLTEAMSGSLLTQIQQCWRQLAQKVELAEPSQLLNAYFETPDQWFRRHDSGLRSRLKKGRFEQTIKLAGQQQGAVHIRPEYNLPCETVLPQLSAFPAHIWPAGTDVAALQQQLTELFRTDFTRISALLTLSDGTVVEAVLDQGEVCAGDRRQPILEMELELVSGDAAQLFRLARQLCQQLPLALGFQSKAERGYMLAQQQPLSWQVPATQLSLAAQLRAFLQNLWLQQRSNTAPGELPATCHAELQHQWLGLRAALMQCQSAAMQNASEQPLQVQTLLNAAQRLSAEPGTAMTLWLLDLSELLLQWPADMVSHSAVQQASGNQHGERA